MGSVTHPASVLMMVVRVVEDQAIADLDEAATEGVDKMILGEDLVGRPTAMACLSTSSTWSQMRASSRSWVVTMTELAGRRARRG